VRPATWQVRPIFIGKTPRVGKVVSFICKGRPLCSDVLRPDLHCIRDAKPIDNQYPFFATRLTWNGHEFLDAVRSDTVWQNTKKTILSKGGSMTFDLVKSVAMELAKVAIKGAMGG